MLSFESAEHDPTIDFDQAIAICARHGGAAESADVDGARSGADREWTDTFVRAPYLRDALIRLGVMVETFETACTWSAYEHLRGAVTDAVAAAGGVVSARFTHVYPDGPAPYFTVYAAAKRGGEVDQWDAMKVAVSDALSRHGGTITHHHAVGRDHVAWIEAEHGRLGIELLLAAKERCDPTGIMNPGKLLPG